LIVPAAAAAIAPTLATKPGTERWPVKTGTDADVAEVGANQRPDGSFDFGLVDTTVEELTSIPRPSAADTPGSETHRVSSVETTVWRLEADVITLKQESDGDYHLVLQGDSGDTMIGEVPTPRAPFVGAASPFLDDITTTRSWVDTNLLAKVPAPFVPVGKTLAPSGALTIAPVTAPVAPPVPGPDTTSQATFKTKIRSQRVTVIGVGFFDRLHGQTGVAPNGIELHPILSLTFTSNGSSGHP
jgi:hypothetical protein